jgi:hypothetical protein
MMLDSIPIVALFAATILIVMLPMEGGYQLGRMAAEMSGMEGKAAIQDGTSMSANAPWRT